MPTVADLYITEDDKVFERPLPLNSARTCYNCASTLRPDDRKCAVCGAKTLRGGLASDACGTRRQS